MAATQSTVVEFPDAEQAAHEALAAVRSLNDRRSMGTRADRRVLEGRATLDRLLDEQPPTDLRVRQVTDLAELGRELSGLSVRTRREVLSLHAGAMPTEAMLQHAARADQELLDRGVHVRVLYPSSFARVGFIRDFVDQQTAAGAMYRFADAIPYRMIISDGLRAVVPHVATSERSGAILTSEAVLVRALRHLAISMLRRGADLDQLWQAGGRTAPTEMELKVIRALSLGLTDEAAAKRLAVSERTFRRHVAAVMERLDAVSRFQAGVRAVERGWM